MKKLIPYGSIVLAAFILVNTIKTIYLYSYYQHGNKAYLKVEKNPGELKGSWKGIFDTYEHGKDVRHIYRYIFDTDSTGWVKSERYYEKIDGNQATTYSWRALLSYKQKRDYNKTAIRVKNGFIIYDPGFDSVIYDTTYSKYEIRGDSLFVDTYLALEPYNDKPRWVFSFSEKPKFRDVLLAAFGF